MKFTKFGKALLMGTLSLVHHFWCFVLRLKLYGRFLVCDGNDDGPVG